MLQHLFIQNYALISELDIQFEKGFSVMTGETGAGKSIILGALSLLLGARADTSAITDGEQKCVIEGEFGIQGYSLETWFEENELDWAETCTIRRELLATGKSRSFINDTPVTLAILKPLAAKLIDIHSQHENLQLGEGAFWLQVVDALADNEAARLTYLTAYEAYRAAEAALTKLKKEAAESQKNADFIAYQLEQLEAAHLREGELEELELTQEKLSSAEEIRDAYARAYHYLDNDEDGGIIAATKDIYSSLHKIETFLPKDADLLNRLESTRLELKDMLETIAGELDDVESDPGRLEEIEERIGFLRSLLRKHSKDTIEELIAERDTYAELINRRDSFDFEIEQAEKHLNEAKKEVKQQADALTKTRKAVVPTIKARLEESLSHLGVRHAAIDVEIKKAVDYTPDGQDETMLLFAANLNQALHPVWEIASGGEMARLMLSVKALLADKQGLPTVIFDEVDTGVSGEVASEMAALMREMAHGRQVLAITHLPQIAARGDHHYRVYKEDTATRTETHIRLLQADERPAEIAMLLSGAKITPEAIRNAEALLAAKV